MYLKTSNQSSFASAKSTEIGLLRYILKAQYPEIHDGKTDILFYFLGKAVNLGKQYVSFIISRAFLEAYKADKLRSFLLRNTAVSEIIDFRNFYVFPKVGITAKGRVSISVGPKYSTVVSVGGTPT